MISFSYKGTSSSNQNLKILKSNHWYMPKRKIEQIQVPGRTGDLIIDEGCTENFELSIECYIKDNNIKDLLLRIYNWLKSDSYELIRFSDGIELKGYFINLEVNEKIDSKSKIITLIFTSYKENPL